MNIYYNPMDVNILVNGNSVAKYYKDGKTYIEAKDGSEYEIQIKNNHCQRVLAVASVDGLNVITGEPASIEDSGYVINPYDSFRIKGFRYSDEKVGAFKFVSKDKSYASEKQVSENCGVIGVKIFNDATSYTVTGTNILKYTVEDIPSSPYIQPLVCDKSYGSNVVMCCNFDMGSGWGSSKESKVTHTNFERGYVTHTFEFYYASRKALIDMGVIESSAPKISFPKSFPKYATPPKNWMC